MRTLKPPEPKNPLPEFKPVLLFSEDDEGVQINIDENNLLRQHISDSDLDIFLPPPPPIEIRTPVVKNETRMAAPAPPAPPRRLSIKTASPNRQGPQRCVVCGKVFANASALAKHKLTHSDERRYVCTMCAKAFKRQDHLNGHMLTHRNKKPYECKAEGCSKSYCDARSLRRHTENHHSTAPTSNTSTPDRTSKTSVQFASAPNDQKQRTKAPNTSEKFTKHHLELVQHVVPKNHQTPAVKSHEASKVHSARTSSPIPSTSTAKPWTLQTSPVMKSSMGAIIKPVECNLCHRKFKNIPALNGHMRLHGGYFKKDSDVRRYEIKDLNAAPLQTASVSVRALIEEKIILKRISKPSATINVDQGPFTVPAGDTAFSQNVGLLQKPVSDDHPIYKKSSKINVKRTTFDLGMPKKMEKSNINFTSTDPDISTFLDPEHGIISIQELTEDDDVSYLEKDVADSLMLDAVDSDSLGDVPTKIEDIDDITALDDCHSPGEILPSSPHSFQHSQDIQNVLDSPLPAGLADFAYSHSQDISNDLQNDTQNYSSASATLSNFIFPLPKLPSSHHSICGNTSSYFSNNGISSTSLSGETIILSSKSPSPSTSSSNVSFQSQMMPNSDDPLLSSSPKEFISRKRVDFHPLKLLQKNTAQIRRRHIGSSQNVAGLLLGSNGEVRVLHTPQKQKHSSNTTSYYNSKSENSIKIKSITLQPKSTYIRKYEKLGPKFQTKEKAGDAVFQTPSLALSPLHLYRKRPRLELNQRVWQYKSRLRNVKSTLGNKYMYTPPPMLQPSRTGKGLYWLAVTTTPSSTTLIKESTSDEGPEAPESDSTPHINVGPEFQAELPDYESGTRNFLDNPKEHLLWDSRLNQIVSDYEVDKYLEFACCAAVPGGGRNKEHALHILHICNGAIQDAILKLMQPVNWLPEDHPLLTFEYTDSEKWNMKEIDAFHQALLKNDKDFSAVAQEIETKNFKQCIQFYYLWKKVCPEEYKKLRIFRKRYREAEHENESTKLDPQSGEAEMVSTTSSEGRLFLCEYQDCSASFNSRAALNGHIRIHVGGTAARCGTPDKRSSQAAESLEEFPCKICGKVFNKVKSRSAHMKSHRPPDADIRKQKSELNREAGILSLNRTGTVSTSTALRTN